jgi:hypothetical protein
VLLFLFTHIELNRNRSARTHFNIVTTTQVPVDDKSPHLPQLLCAQPRLPPRRPHHSLMHDQASRHPPRPPHPMHVQDAFCKRARRTTQSSPFSTYIVLISLARIHAMHASHSSWLHRADLNLVGANLAVDADLCISCLCTHLWLVLSSTCAACHLTVVTCCSTTP